MFLELPVVDSASKDARPSEHEAWRSLEHRANTEEFQHFTKGEFVEGALDEPSGHNRRTFLQLMGASMALAGLSACRRPVERIMPYTRQPEEVIPGEPLQYATAMPFGNRVSPLLVTAYEGRPTKIEGNPDHPVSQGATGVFEQASVLNLYDPDRSRYIRHDGVNAPWQDFVRFGRSLVAQAAAHRAAILIEPTSSPTLLRLRDQFEAAFPNGRWIPYAPGGDDNGALGAQAAYGRPLRTSYRFSEAAVIVSLDADFLSSTDPNYIQNAREFAESRRLESAEDDMSRFYVVESNYTNTGGMADHRLRLRSSDIPAFAAALAARLGVGGTTANAERFADHPWIDVIAEDLQQHAGAAVVVPGATQPPFVHALCARINQALGAQGSVVELFDTGEAEMQPQGETMRDLVAAMNAGDIDTLIVIGCNPVYDAPGDLDFAAALRNVTTSIHLGEWYDETARACRWHIPRSHYLEAWGDGRAADGTLSVIQPLISPLYDTKSDVELLNLAITGRDLAGFDLVQETWRGEIPGDFDAGWRQVLHDGFLEGSATSPSTAAAGDGEAGDFELAAGAATEDDIEVVFRLDNKVYDGRFANNAWLQELPEPVTKVTWDNVAVMSPATAERLGVGVRLRRGMHYADLVEISSGDHTVELPVWIVPGHADNSITVTLGYGRDIHSTRQIERPRLIGAETNVYRPGPLANGVGKNVSVLRRSGSPAVLRGAEVSGKAASHLVASAQEHGSMEGRPIARIGTLEQFRAQPTFAQDAVPPLLGGELEPWEEYPEIWAEDHPRQTPVMHDTIYSQYQWGMVVDLNTCVGCSACVVACQSENNIQVVGKDQVTRGREMHWMRIDRYYTGDADDPGMVFQPMLCMHCENAPCEPVCPVAATTHSPDGINEMTYNRCIGTRYCSNNCPYKIRRFNFYNWSRSLPLEVQMAQNPNVTVRFRGVMEKCTYCVQRIRRSGEAARIAGRTLEDGEVMTACQQVCPANAITFGNIADENSQVSVQRRNPRRYELLAEYNTKPRTSYLGRVRNPNPRLAGAAPVGQS